MANWDILKRAISDAVKTNGNQEITGAVLQSTLNTIVSNLGENATFKGVATPAMTPGTPDGPLFYIAYEKGIYANFNAITITEEDGLVIILYSSNWNKINIPLALKDELVQFRSDLSNGILDRVNAFLRSDNTIANFPNNPSVGFTKYLAAIVGLKITRAHAFTSSNGTHAIFYDGDFNPVGRISGNNESSSEIELTSENIPSGAVYVRFNIYVPNFTSVKNVIPVTDEYSVRHCGDLATAINTGLTAINTGLTAVNNKYKSFVFSLLEERGNILLSDGTTVDSYDNKEVCYTKYLQALVGLKIRAHAYTSSSFRYAWFYNENFNVVGYLNASGDSDVNVTLTSENIPSGAVYVRFNILQPNNLTEISNANPIYGRITKDLTLGLSDVTSNNNNIFEVLEEFKKFLLSDGISKGNMPSDDFCYTKYLKALPGLKIKAHSFPASQYKYAWFYNKDLEVIGFLAGSTDASIDVELTAADIPSGAVYVRFNIFKPQNISVVSKALLADFNVKKESSMIFSGKLVADTSQNQWGWEPGLCQGSIGKINHDYDNSFIYNTELIPVYPNSKYHIGHRESAESEFFYDADGNFIGYAKPQSGAVSGVDFITPANASYIRFSALKPNPSYIGLTYEGGFSTEEIKKNTKDIEELKNQILTDDFTILPSTTIYGRIINKSDSFIRFNNSVYPEGLVAQAGVQLRINGGREYRLNTNHAADGSEIVKLTSLAGKTKELTLSYKNVSPSSVSGKKMVLCIGESTTAAGNNDPYEGAVGSWGWPSSIKQYSICDRADNVGLEILTLGTRGNYNREFTYKNTSYNIRSFHEGYSGWPSYALLNWPCPAKFTSNLSNAFGAKNMWYALGLATKTPYSQSSYNTDREEFVSNLTEEQRALMASTPFGKYKVDGDESLWNLMQTLSGSDGYPVFQDLTSSYNGSAEQLAMMQTWAEALAADPINPFYSLTEARTGVSGTGFSLSTYLLRYRTMDDAGNRLIGSAGQIVQGQDGNTYTIGTKVNNTLDYDVCIPTEIIINIGLNDSEWNSVAVAVDSLKKMVSQFTVPTAFFITRISGACVPGDWGDVAVVHKYSPLTHTVGVMQEMKPWFETQADKYLLPIYAIQYPCSITTEFVEYGVEGKQHINCMRGDVHPGVYAYRSIGFQCLNWLYYLASL